MKLRNTFFYTLRENVKDEESISANLLVRAGFIKKTSAGIYMFMPLGYKVLKKIENIIREEMNLAGALEMQMPFLIAEEYYAKSGRLANFGPSVYTLNDRSDKKMVLGPTDEELFVVAAKSMIKSYKHMPFNLYQIQTKFRDEPRARYGLIRVKEFSMKDAYSFDLDSQGLDVSYQIMFEAYKKIFDRLGLKYRIVKADTGVMGGLLSEEFQAITDIGEDTIVYCEESEFSSNQEIAPCVYPNHKPAQQKSNLYEKVYTPNAKTIKEVCDFLNKDASKFIKTLIYLIDEKPYAVLLRGDREVSEVKLLKALSAQNAELADEKTVVEVAGSKIGFVGPIDLKCPIIADEEVLYMNDFICGANQENYHLINVNNLDFNCDLYKDIRKIAIDDVCPITHKPLKFTKGIEIGNTFKLGTKYAESLGLTYLDQNNTNQSVWMGSYGIGLGRCLAAYIEQNHDDNGMILNKSIAPFEIAIIPVNEKDQLQNDVAISLYEHFKNLNYDVVLDDRLERVGVKFKDMDLIGVPYRITIGKNINEGLVEFKPRNQENILINIEELKNNFHKYFK